MKSVSVLRDALPRIATLRPLIDGARVLQAATDEEVREPLAAALLDAGASSVTLEERGFHAWEVPFDLVWIHEASASLDWELLTEVAKGGTLVASLTDHGIDLFGRSGQRREGAYETLASLLAESFPSVEVAVQSTVTGAALSFPRRRSALSADPFFDSSPSPSSYVFICGDKPCGIEGQWVVPLPPKEILRGEVRPADPSSPGGEDLGRRLREAREREDSARSRAREAESRLRELERKMEAFQAEQADLSVAFRREQRQAEMAQRNAEGVFEAVAERDRLLEKWKQRALDAERRAAELEARLSRTLLHNR